jgi:uridylate kinase
MAYKRVLLKLSGEQLSGEFEGGIDPKVAAYLAAEVEHVVKAGCQVIIIAGGGNLVRGAEVAGNGIKRVTGDQMGMLSGLINSVAITDIFESKGVITRCLSNIFAPQVAESYSFRLAEKHLERGRVIIVAGGIGRPYFTHDTAAVNLALELSCDVVMKATKFDGVYDKDPAKCPDAKKIHELTAQEALSNPKIKVMDKAAMGLALEHGIEIIVFNAMKTDNFLNAVIGHRVGTKIS